MASGVLRLRDFRLVFGASVVSLIGDSVVPVALAFAVLDLTGSATDLGIVLASQTAALVGSLLVGGVVADRLGRRAVMVGADVTRFATQAGIAVLLIDGRATVAEIAASQALLGAASGFFYPASSGLLPAVAGGRLREANALFGLARSRVSSYDWFGSLAFVPLGYALVGPLAAAIGISAALRLCGTAELALLVSMLSVRDVRRLEART